MDQFTPQTPQPPAQAPMTAPMMPAYEPPRRSGLFKKLLVGGIVLGVIIIGVILWWMLNSNGKSLTVSVAAPDSLQTGVPVAISVNMSNDSGSNLKDAQVSLSLPDGLIFVDTPGSRTVENQNIGNLPANQLTKATFMVMATTVSNTIVPLKAAVSYIPGALSSRFEKDIQQNLVIGEPGITLNVAPPTKVFGGEDFDTEISYTNNSQTNLDDVQLTMNYPAGFTFKSSTQAASDTMNTIWHLGPLAAGAQGTFSVKGYVVGQDNENFAITATMNASIGEGRYDIATQTATVTAQPSPLSIHVDVDPSDTAIFGLGDTLHYRLSYTNNTSIGLRSVIIQAKLTGDMLDLRTLKTNGVLRAVDNTIIWNAASVPDFATLAPGANGYLEFSLAVKSSYPITRLSSKNYTVLVHAEIASPTVPAGVEADQTLGVAELTNKIRGQLNVAAIGYYRDAASGIVNSGVFPPKVGQPTQFTIHWVLRNMSTDIDTVHVHAFLGPNVRYTGISKTNVASSSLSYNDRTQEVSWDVSQIQATRGVLTDPLDMTFQVEMTPAIDQVQTSPAIIQATGVEYHDGFTGESLTAAANEVTTRLPDDATLGGSNHAVVQ